MTAINGNSVYVFLHLSLVLLNNMTSAKDYAVRLVNPKNPSKNVTEGRLEIYYAGEWGTVCDDGIKDVAAKVICASLGYGYAGTYISNSYFGAGTGQIWLDDVVCNGSEQSIDKCKHRPWGNNDCNHNEDLSVACDQTENYAVRLVNSNNPSINQMEGRLEIHHNGIWGTVCDDGFTDVAAKVVCASLGYGYVGTYISNSFYGAGTGQIWLDDVICTGREQSIEKCSHRPWGAHDCNHNEDVSVRCGTAQNSAVRLVNTFSDNRNVNEGRLEIYYSGSWGTVCDNGFTNASAKVACASLGFGYIGTVIGNRHGSGTGDIWLKDVVCADDEKSIVECMHSLWRVYDCTHDEDVSISCGTTSRLVNSLYASNNSQEGRLEIYYGGVWGTVCDDNFTNATAELACASLGFGYNGIFIGNRHGNGTGHIWVDAYICNRTEQRIDMCSRNSSGVYNCGHHKDVSIKCGDNQDFAVRLINSLSNNSKEGRLEIYYSGIWGTVCSNDFTDISARVACASLGFGYVGAVIGNRYGGGTDAIWLDNVKCNGKESSLEQCTHRGWGVHDCDHGKDVSISCAITRDYTVRLNNSQSSEINSMEGRLEIYYNGIWGTVCDDGFTDASARVACASLSFGHVGRVINRRHGSGTGQIWLDDVVCGGTEEAINKCSHNAWGLHNCNHIQDVSISCGDTEDFAVRLVNSKNPSRNVMEGRIEIYYAGVWGTVCDDGFKDVAATVVCFSLGYGRVGSYISNSYYGAGTGQIWLDNIRCTTGNEQSIDKCSHSDWGRHDCNHNEDVSVTCGTAQNFAVRLVNSLSDSANPSEGRLEIYYSGSWGTVCDNGFTNASARVACAKLGFGYVGAFIGNRYGGGKDVIWLNDVQCNGTESSIEQCSHRGWGIHNCDNGQDVSISCVYSGTSTTLVDDATPGPDIKVIAIAALASLMGLGILLAATFIYRNVHKARQAETDNGTPKIRMKTIGSSGNLEYDTAEAKRGEDGYEDLHSSCISHHYDEIIFDDYQTINDYIEGPCLKLQSGSYYEEVDTSNCN